MTKQIEDLKRYEVRRFKPFRSGKKDLLQVSFVGFFNIKSEREVVVRDLISLKQAFGKTTSFYFPFEGDIAHFDFLMRAPVECRNAERFREYVFHLFMNTKIPGKTAWVHGPVTIEDSHYLAIEVSCASHCTGKVMQIQKGVSQYYSDHKSQWERPEKDDMVCAICLEYVENLNVPSLHPVVGGKGHFICVQCFSQHWKNIPACPYCMEPLNHEDIKKKIKLWEETKKLSRKISRQSCEENDSELKQLSCD